jgi:hypothetical protein
MRIRPRARRRHIIVAAAAAGGMVICLLVGTELVARTVVDHALSAAAPAGVTVTPAGSSAWGLLTGSMPVTIRIDQTVLAEMLGDRVDSVRIDEVIVVSTARTTPIGDVPIEVELTPVIESGALGVEVVEAQINGMSLPGTAVDGLGPFTLPDSIGGCGRLTATSAAVDGDSLVVDGSMPLNRDTAC